MIFLRTVTLNRCMTYILQILLGFIRSIFNLETSSDTDWSLRTIKVNVRLTSGSSGIQRHRLNNSIFKGSSHAGERVRLRRVRLHVRQDDRAQLVPAFRSSASQRISRLDEKRAGRKQTVQLKLSVTSKLVTVGEWSLTSLKEGQKPGQLSRRSVVRSHFFVRVIFSSGRR